MGACTLLSVCRLKFKIYSQSCHCYSGQKGNVHLDALKFKALFDILWPTYSNDRSYDCHRWRRSPLTLLLPVMADIIHTWPARCWLAWSPNKRLERALKVETRRRRRFCRLFSSPLSSSVAGQGRIRQRLLIKFVAKLVCCTRERTTKLHRSRTTRDLHR